MQLSCFKSLQPDASLSGIGLLRFPAEGSNGCLQTFVPGAGRLLFHLGLSASAILRLEIPHQVRNEGVLLVNVNLSKC